jgi:hypothetical protein
VLDGLKEGDRVVSRGNFLLDSQFQISGKPSLLYPEGMAGSGHTHGSVAGQTKRGGAAAAAKIKNNLEKLSAADKELAMAQENCPVTDQPLGSMGVPIKIDVEGQDVFLCCAGCTPAVKKDARAILDKLKSGTSTDEHREHNECAAFRIEVPSAA